MGARPGTVRTKKVSAIAAITRHNGPEDPRLPELKRDLLAAELEEILREKIDAHAEVTLTAEQRLHLAGILTGGGS